MNGRSQVSGSRGPSFCTQWRIDWVTMKAIRRGSLCSLSSWPLQDHSHGPSERPPEPRRRLQSQLWFTLLPRMGFGLAAHAPSSRLASSSWGSLPQNLSSPGIRQLVTLHLDPVEPGRVFTQECSQLPAANGYVGRRVSSLLVPGHSSACYRHLVT